VIEMNLIETFNIKKKYFLDKVIVNALNGVSLKISKGDFAVIVGPSGSGKSTLLHLLGALDHPTSGAVKIDGKIINQLDDDQLALFRRNKMGFIFQAFNLIPSLTALENVMIPTEPTKEPQEEAEERAISILDKVGLSERIYHKPGELSGGQRQRVSIARSLINNPEIIYADEPTGNLDSVTGEKVIDLMRHLNKKEKKTFVVVTHDETLLKFASIKFILKDGLLHKIHGKDGAKKFVD